MSQIVVGGLRRATPPVRRLALGLWCGVLATALTAIPLATAGATSKASTQALHDLISSSDFPKGWKPTGKPTSTATTTSTGTSRKTIDAIAKCEGVSSSVDVSAPTASLGFTNAESSEYALEAVVVFPSTTTAQNAFRIFSDAKAPACVGSEIAHTSSSSGSGGTASKISTSKLAVPKIDQGSTGFLVTFPAPTTGKTVTIQTDFVVVRNANVMALLAVIAVPTKFPTALTKAIAKKAGAKLH